MTYLLDTNTCIRYLNGLSPSVRVKLQALAPSGVTVCAIVKAELFTGSEKSQRPGENLEKQRSFLQPYVSLPFDDKAAEVYGRIRAVLERKGITLGANDLMIAAIALANDLTLVTHNTDEFNRVEGLKLEDWEA